MQTPTLLTTLVVISLTTALPHIPRQAPAPSATDITCTQAMILAEGISLNIMDQQQELATANTMQTLLQAPTVDTATWAATRTTLLQFVNNGIAIREMNQLITPAQNRATSGIATVANAQLTELMLATSLTPTGADDVQGNLRIVQMLQMNFAGGIVQNQKNMADASQSVSACGSGAAPAVAASNTTQPAAAQAPAAAAPAEASSRPSAAAAASPAKASSNPNAPVANEPAAATSTATAKPAGGNEGGASSSASQGAKKITAQDERMSALLRRARRVV